MAQDIAILANQTDETSPAENADSNKPSPLSAEFRIHRAIESQAPHVYANGFVTGLAAGDVLIVFERNNQPACVLNLSFTVAKTLANSLGKTIASLEDSAGQEIMTTQKIEEFTKKNRDD